MAKIRHRKKKSAEIFNFNFVPQAAPLCLCHFTTYEAVSACYGKQPWNSAFAVSLLYRFGVLLPLRLRTCVSLDFRARLTELLKTHTSWSSNLSSCRRTGFVCSFFLEFFRNFLCSSSRMVKWSETAVCSYRFLWRVSCFQERRTDQQSCFNWLADSPSRRSRERLLLDFSRCGLHYSLVWNYCWSSADLLLLLFERVHRVLIAVLRECLFPKLEQ